IYVKSFAAVLFTLGLLGLFPPAKANLMFQVTTDTSALVGNPSGPFFLDFQFIDGSGTGDGNNTVSIGNFDFNGGNWAGPAAVSMSDTTFFSDFTQEFTPGSSLSFQVTLSTALDGGGTPDEFSFAILDSYLSEIPTLGLGDALLTVDLSSSSP